MRQESDPQVPKAEVRKVILADFERAKKRFHLETQRDESTLPEDGFPIYRELLLALEMIDILPGCRKIALMQKAQLQFFALEDLEYRTEAYHFGRSNNMGQVEIRERDIRVKEAVQFCLNLGIAGTKIVEDILKATPSKDRARFLQRLAQTDKLITYEEARAIAKNLDLEDSA